MRKTILLILFQFLSISIFSQIAIDEESMVNNGFDGTFQIEIHNIRLQPNIPGNINEIVSNNRSDSETVYYPLDQNIRIRIPSRNEISDPNFQKLDLIKYF